MYGTEITSSAHTSGQRQHTHYPSLSIPLLPHPPTTISSPALCSLSCIFRIKKFEVVIESIVKVMRGLLLFYTITEHCFFLCQVKRWRAGDSVLSLPRHTTSPRAPHHTTPHRTTPYRTAPHLRSTLYPGWTLHPATPSPNVLSIYSFTFPYELFVWNFNEHFLEGGIQYMGIQGNTNSNRP